MRPGDAAVAATPERPGTGGDGRVDGARRRGGEQRAWSDCGGGERNEPRRGVEFSPCAPGVAAGEDRGAARDPQLGSPCCGRGAAAAGEALACPRASAVVAERHGSPTDDDQVQAPAGQDTGAGDCVVSDDARDRRPRPSAVGSPPERVAQPGVEAMPRALVPKAKSSSPHGMTPSYGMVWRAIDRPGVAKVW